MPLTKLYYFSNKIKQHGSKAPSQTRFDPPRTPDRGLRRWIVKIPSFRLHLTISFRFIKA